MKSILCLLICACCITSVQAKSITNSNASKNLVADSAKLIPYFGNYKFKTNELVESVVINFEKGKLICVANDGNNYTLEEVVDKADNFIISTIAAEVVFVRDANKKVIGLKLNVQGQELTADKEEIKK
jgi:hypothetical protein